MTTGRINQVTFLAVQAWHPTTLLREDGGARETLTLAQARSTGRPKPHTAGRRKRCFSFKVGSWSQKAQAPEGERPPPHDSLILSIFHCAADALKANSLTLESNSRKRAFQRQRACCKQCQRRLQARTLREGRAERLTRTRELFSVSMLTQRVNIQTSTFFGPGPVIVSRPFCTLLNFRELEHDFASLRTQRARSLLHISPIFVTFFFLSFFNVRQFHLRPSRAIARGSDRQAQTSRDASSQLFFAFQLSHCFHDYIAPRRTPPHLNALTAFALF